MSGSTRSVALVATLSSTRQVFDRVTQWLGSVEVVAVSEEDVLAAVAQGSPAWDLLVIGVEVSSPIRLAQRIRGHEATLPLIVMCGPGELERLAFAVRRSPFLGMTVACCAVDDLRTLTSTALSLLHRRPTRPDVSSDVQSRERGSVTLAPRLATQSSQFIDRLLELAPVGTVMLDPSGRMIGWNLRAASILALLERDAAGTMFMDHVDPGSRETASELIRHALSSGESAPATVRCGPPGTTRWVELLATCVMGAHGEPCVLAVLQDVTARIEAEATAAALRRDQARLAALVGNASEVVVLASAEGQLLFVNGAASRLLGVEASSCGTVRLLDLMANEDRSNVALDVLPVVWRTGAWAGELRLRNGRTRIDALVNLFLVDVEGEERPALGLIARDIRERVRAEATIREREARFRTLFDDCPISIWEEDFSEVKRRVDKLMDSGVMDLRAFLDANPDVLDDLKSRIRIVDVNQASVDLFRAGDKATLLAGVRVGVGRENHALYRDEFVAVADGERRFEAEANSYTRDGLPIHVVVRWLVAPGHEGDYSRVLVCILDVTRQKEAEDALRQVTDALEQRVRDRTVELRAAEAEARRTAAFLDSIVENLPHMVFVKEAADLKFARFNRAGEELLGVHRTALLGKSDYDFFPREEADFFTEKDRMVLEGHVVVDIPEEPIHTHAHGLRFLHTKKIPLYGPDGRPEYLLGISEDITERKRAAETLAQKAAELERSNAELEQFAYVASHDLQEPVRKIQAFANLIAGKLAPLLDEAGGDLLQRIQSAARRMQQLINDVLLYSRVTTQAQPFCDVDLAQVMEQVLVDLEDAPSRDSAQIRIGPLPVVQADAVQMHQLLQNLVGNALKFHHPGTAPRVTVEARESSMPGPNGDGVTCDAIELSIRDEGIGFDPRHAERIFMPFQRLHGRGAFEGTGMGLAICRKIVERHGGSIVAEGQPEGGACFVVRLPKVRGRHERDEDASHDPDGG